MKEQKMNYYGYYIFINLEFDHTYITNNHLQKFQKKLNIRSHRFLLILKLKTFLL